MRASCYNSQASTKRCRSLKAARVTRRRGSSRRACSISCSPICPVALNCAKRRSTRRRFVPPMTSRSCLRMHRSSMVRSPTKLLPGSTLAPSRAYSPPATTARCRGSFKTPLSLAPPRQTSRAPPMATALQVCPSSTRLKTPLAPASSNLSTNYFLATPRIDSNRTSKCPQSTRSRPTHSRPCSGGSRSAPMFSLRMWVRALSLLKIPL